MSIGEIGGFLFLVSVGFVITLAVILCVIGARYQ